MWRSGVNPRLGVSPRLLHVYLCAGDWRRCSSCPFPDAERSISTPPTSSRAALWPRRLSPRVLSLWLANSPAPSPALSFQRAQSALQFLSPSWLAPERGAARWAALPSDRLVE